MDSAQKAKVLPAQKLRKRVSILVIMDSAQKEGRMWCRIGHQGVSILVIMDSAQKEWERELYALDQKSFNPCYNG